MLYSCVMLLALGVCGVLLRRSQRGLGVSAREKLGIGIGAFCGAMLGAKLPFVLSDWNGFLQGTAWFADGKTILAGLVGGYLGVELAKYYLGTRTKTGDSFAAPVAAGVAIGRLACFCGGCCYGAPTSLPWGVVFPAVDALPRHPTQIYEAIFHASMAGLLANLRDRRAYSGNLIKLYIIAYAIYRFGSEWLRPEIRLWHGLTGYQMASVAIAGLFAWLWWRDRRQC